MNKGTIIGLVIAIIVIIAGVAGFAIYRNSSSEKNNNQVSNSNVQKSSEIIEDEEEDNDTNVTEDENDDTEDTDDTDKSNGSKVLVVYYSAQSHTRKVAERIASNLNADIFEIVPVDVYSEDDLDWTDKKSRVCKEYADESLRDIELENIDIDNWEDYDTILIGYPIWWGIAAWPVDNFVKENDFDGKTVIPFCTSYSSGLGQSGKLLQDESNGGTWQTGQRFQQDAKNSDIDKWTDNLELQK